MSHDNPFNFPSGPFQLADLSCMVYQKSTCTYAPYNKDWIKEKIYVLLKQAAGNTDWWAELDTKPSMGGH